MIYFDRENTKDGLTHLVTNLGGFKNTSQLQMSREQVLNVVDYHLFKVIEELRLGLSTAIPEALLEEFDGTQFVRSFDNNGCFVRIREEKPEEIDVERIVNEMRADLEKASKRKSADDAVVIHAFPRGRTRILRRFMDEDSFKKLIDREIFARVKPLRTGIATYPMTMLAKLPKPEAETPPRPMIHRGFLGC